MLHIKLAKRFTSALLIALFFLIAPAAFEIINDNTQKFVLERQSASVFFVYEKIEPTKDSFTKEEELGFASHLNVFRTIDFTWNDILRCNYLDSNAGYVFVGSQESSAKNVSVGEDKVSTWVWTGTKPQTPAVCFLEANITADVGYGVEKDQKYKTREFRIE